MTQVSGECRRGVFEAREEVRHYPSRRIPNDERREACKRTRSDAGGHIDMGFTMPVCEQSHGAEMNGRARVSMELFMPGRCRADQAGEKNHTAEERGERDCP